MVISWAAQAQECPMISFPTDGAADIPVDVTITWPAVEGINGYLISLGTTPGGSELLDREAIGVDNFYRAPTGLPKNTLIYVSLSILLFNAQPQPCNTITFTTIDVTEPPPCTILVAPDDNAANVTIVTDIHWAYAPTATSYNLSIGTVPNGTDILDNLEVGNVLTYEPPEDLPQDTQIYVTVIPSNENGDMAPCTEESFKTGPAPFACDPVVDEITGETTFRMPEIEFPSVVGLCSDELPYIIGIDDTADGFRWYRTNVGSAETLFAEGREISITEPGRYRYEAYNNILQSNGGIIECTSSKLFTIITSEVATIKRIDVASQGSGRIITITTNGAGDYEYALDNIEGPYQDSPVFENVFPAPRIAYVRDKNGCGIAERTVDRDLGPDDFPKFFTPNGDGVNDYWQYIAPPENFELNLRMISIFDRYGSLLGQIDPISRGWDGRFRGRQLPSSDYWFRAVTFDNLEIRGHFALKR
jgi:gliding motility-associated-like protein